MKYKKILIFQLILLAMSILMSIWYVYHSVTPKIGPVGDGVDMKKVWTKVATTIAFFSATTLSSYLTYKKHKNDE